MIGPHGRWRLPSAGAFLTMAFLVCTAPHAAAQGLGLTSKSDQPVVIEADKSVEWRKTEQVYVARGNATAKRGETTLRADVLTAHYRQRTGQMHMISRSRTQATDVSREYGAERHRTRSTLLVATLTASILAGCAALFVPAMWIG